MSVLLSSFSWSHKIGVKIPTVIGVSICNQSCFKRIVVHVLQFLVELCCITNNPIPRFFLSNTAVRIPLLIQKPSTNTLDTLHYS